MSEPKPGLGLEGEVARLHWESAGRLGLGMYIYALDGTVRFIDRGALRIAELTERFPDPTQAIGSKLEDLFHYVDEPGRLRQALLEHKRVTNFEYRIRTLAGNLRWVHHDSTLLEAEDGGEPSILTVCFDITELKQATGALAESEEWKRVLLQSADDVIFVLDRDIRFRWVNQRAASTLGLAPTEVIGRHMSEIFPAGAAERQADSVRRVFETAEPFRAQVPTQTPRGEIWFNTALSPVFGAGGEVSAVMGVSRNITAQVRAEQLQRQVEERISHAQKLESLGLMAGGIAHDFNNLLVAVLGNADLALMDLPAGSPARLAVEQIRNAAVRASELTNQMLAYSGKGQFLVRAVDLNAQVEEIDQLAKVSLSKKVTLTHDLATDLPPVWVDSAQLQQVIMNLVANAGEAIGDGDGTVRVKTHLVEADRRMLDGGILDDPLPAGRYVCLQVSDDGEGMDETTQGRMFDPFFSTKVSGRGLGLAAVLGVIRSHRGTILVESEQGQGTTLRVLLPAGEPVEEASTPEAESLADFRGEGLVLVIDDERAVRQVAHDMLTRLGFQVVVARDGLEGLDQFRQHRDELVAVLLDLTMPRLGGAETFQHLHQEAPELPVLLCSGYSEVESVSRFAEQGLAGFLQKPFEIKNLAREMGRLLKGRP